MSQKVKKDTNNRRNPPPPRGLSTRARALWTKVVDGSTTSSRRALIAEALCALSEAEQARRVLKREGLTFTTPSGMVRQHPAVQIEREARKEFRVIWRQLDLDRLADGPFLPLSFVTKRMGTVLDALEEAVREALCEVASEVILLETVDEAKDLLMRHVLERFNSRLEDLPAKLGDDA